MQNYWKKILSTLLVATFILIIFIKIMPIFINPVITIKNIESKNGYYTVTGNLKNGNELKVFDNHISLDSNNNFKFEVIKYNITSITIYAYNVWGRSTIQNLYLENK
jgi:hypothetical protein